LTMGVCMGTFLVGMIGAMAAGASNILSDILRYLSPLRYFDNNYIMSHGAYETGYLILSVALPVVLTVASFVIYVKKDIRAAV